MGKPCAISAVMKIAKQHNLIVISDDCEAHGAMYKVNILGIWLTWQHIPFMWRM